MSYIFKKYEFPDEATAKTRIAALPTDEEGNPIHKHSIKDLGYLWITEPTYDEEGNEISEGTKANLYSVDVLWSKDEILQSEEQTVDGVTHIVQTVKYPYGWASKEIQYDETWRSINGAHKFIGWKFFE
jgi:hypothetical protein